MPPIFTVIPSDDLHSILAQPSGEIAAVVDTPSGNYRKGSRGSRAAQPDLAMVVMHFDLRVSLFATDSSRTGGFDWLLAIAPTRL